MKTGTRVVAAALSGDAQVTAWAMKLCGARIADLERQYVLVFLRRLLHISIYALPFETSNALFQGGLIAIFYGLFSCPLDV